MKTFSKFLLILIAIMVVAIVVSKAQDSLYNKKGELIYIKPPKPVELVSVDNYDTKFVYAPAWTHNGSTTAKNFFMNTMAYDATGGRTVTLTFTGTLLQAYCEMKQGHGSAAFQIDNLPAETKVLGVAGPEGSTLVFENKNLAPGTHTFKLTVVGSGNVVFDYVKINGQALTPTPPIPPVTGMIFLMPGVSMKPVVEAAASGTKFQLGNGNYPENIVKVPAGVGIYPPSSGIATVTMTGTHPDPAGAKPGQLPGSNREIAVFMLESSGARSTVGQTISGFTILGLDKATGGIYVNNRDNVHILNVKVQDCVFSGIWFRGVATSEVAYCESFNSAGVVSSGWVAGEMNITNVNKVDIHHSKFWNNKVGSNGQSQKGYGIKSLYQDGPFNCHIFNNVIQLPGRSPWDNGRAPNIAIEFNDATPNGIEINNNTLANCISMACHKETLGGRIWIHDNDALNMVGADFFVEIVASNMTIERNKVAKCAMLTANYNPNGTNNGHHKDIIVDGNEFTSNKSNPSWGGVFLLGFGGIDITYRNNRFGVGNIPTSSTNSFALFRHTGATTASKIVDGGGNVFLQ